MRLHYGNNVTFLRTKYKQLFHLYFYMSFFYTKSLLYSLFFSIFAVAKHIFALTLFDINDKIVSYTTLQEGEIINICCELLTKSYHIQFSPMSSCCPLCCELLTKSYHIQHQLCAKGSRHSCELLTISYHIQCIDYLDGSPVVVNC